MQTNKPRPRIIIADDEPALLFIYRQALSRKLTKNTSASRIEELEQKLFPEKKTRALETLDFDLTTCRQASEVVEQVSQSIEDNNPFSIAYLDVRMPPGKDGVWAAETIRKIDPDIEIVIVTAFSDVDPKEIAERVPPINKLLFLVKPFHIEEILHFSNSLYYKWKSEREAKVASLRLNKELSTKNEEIQKLNEKRMISNSIVEKYRNELEASENRYKLLFDESGDSVFLLNINGTILDINRQFCLLVGLKKEDIIKRNINEIIINRNKNLNILHLIISNLENPFEFEFFNHQIEKIYIEINAKQAHLGKNEVYLGICRDISLRKQAEEILIKHSMVYKNMDEGVVICDANQLIIDVNPSFEKIFNYSIDELYKNKLCDFFSQTNLTKDIQDQINNTGGWKGEFIYNHKTDKKIWLKSTIKELKNYKNEIIGYLSIHDDITEQIVALTEKIEAEKIAHKSVRLASLGALAGGIVHEINQPLTTLKAEIDSLISWEKKDSSKISREEIFEVLDTISDETNKINDIINHIRNLIRDGNDNTKRILNLSKAITESVNYLKKKIDLYDIQIITNLDNAIELFCNPTSIEQIIVNLVKNAIHALLSIDRKNKNILISTSANNKTVTISIKDDGPGITDKKKKNIFDPFFTTKGPVMGMGLGLTIVDTYVTGLSGKIEVISETGKGTEFVITIPVDKKMKNERKL